MTSRIGACSWTPRQVRALIGIVIVALNLRLALASVPPLLPTIQHDLLLSRGAAGLLTTIPVVCMGVFTPLAVRLGARFGMERTILFSVSLLCLGTLARGIEGGVVGLYGATLGIGIGMAIAGTLLTGFIKARFAQKAAFVMGLYAAGMSAGAAGAAGGTAPLGSALGGSWHAALSLWGILTAAACCLWLITVGTSRFRGENSQGGANVSLPWRSPVAWKVTIVFALQSSIYYAILTWLAPLYRDHGWGASEAGLGLSVFSMFQIAGSIAIPLAASRSTDRRLWLMGTSGLTGIILIIVGVSPTLLPWLWIILLGFSLGGLFPLALMLPLDYADTPTATTALAAMALGVGYVLAALAPVLAGALIDVSGAYTIPFEVLAGLSGALILTVVRLKPYHVIDSGSPQGI